METFIVLRASSQQVGPAHPHPNLPWGGEGETGCWLCVTSHLRGFMGPVSSSHRAKRWLLVIAGLHMCVPVRHRFLEFNVTVLFSKQLPALPLTSLCFGREHGGTEQLADEHARFSVDVLAVIWGAGSAPNNRLCHVVIHKGLQVATLTGSMV